MKNLFLYLFSFFTIGFFSCKEKPLKQVVHSTLNLNDSLPNKRFGKSEIINSKFNPKLFFGIWTLSYDDPACDFEMDEKVLSFCDYDGESDRLYKIIVDSVFLDNPFLIFKGKIVKATGDSLIIHWQENKTPETYLRWKDEEVEEVEL